MTLLAAKFASETMPSMDFTDLMGHLESDGELITAALTGADWSSSVPGTKWDLRTLVVHTSAVHRWATDLIERGLQSNETGGSAAFRANIVDHDLRAWFVEGHAALVTALLAAADDIAVFTFLPLPVPRHFWARRQAHETAIHRADVQAAVGEVDSFDAEFAQDGIAELVAGFARQSRFASTTAGALALRCTDGPSWLVNFGGERTLAVCSDDESTATATVTGSSSELYLWVWNRPADVQVAGDETTIASWQRICI